MSAVLVKALANVGLQVQADKLPKKNRNVKTFQKLWAEVRDRVDELENDSHEKDCKINDLLEKLNAARLELMKYKFKERADSIGSLTMADKTKLLELN